jgi:hypothetical protein
MHRHSHSDQPAAGVIGRAFRRSLLVIVLAAVAIALAVYLTREAPEPTPVVDEAPVAAPEAAPRAPVEVPALPFTDVTRTAGIDFVHVNGAYGKKLLPETMGSGAAFFDYDNDGDADLLLVNSNYWPGHRPPGTSPPHLALYRNDGAGGFTDVTAAAGLGVSLYGMGVAVGDYDNDGLRDLYITALGGNRLLRNVQGRYQDVTESAGVAGGEDDWSTSAAFLDVDNDGDLDLFVANYVRWSEAIDYEVDFRLTGIGRAYGPPSAYEGDYCVLYRNDGDGTFSDISEAAGIRVDNPATGRPMAKALGVGPVDLDGDGWMDLLVANDTVQNFFFHNLGDGRFEEVGTVYGLAFDRNGAATGAMGVDAAHYRGDAALGLAVGNFANEMTSLYVTQGLPSLLADESIVEGIGPASRLVLTFGLFFFDADLDGRLDLLQANGHLEDEINEVQPSQHYAQPSQLFWNCGPDCPAAFALVKEDGDLSEPAVGRGATYADVDGDGDLDVLITQNGRSPRLLRNDQASGHHWLRVRLVGTTSNRDAIGAWVELTAGGRTQRRQVMPTRSYVSQVELPVTFGLGASETVEALRVHWPGGGTQDVQVPGVDRRITVEQAD